MNSGETAIPNVARSAGSADQIGKPGALENSIPIEAQPSLNSETAVPILNPQSELTTTADPKFASAFRILCPWMPWLAVMYVLGVTVMSLRLLTRLSRGARLRSRSTVATDANLLSLVEELTRTLGLKVAPAVYYCEQIIVPAVIGVDPFARIAGVQPCSPRAGGDPQP